ncbi:hypothetical protein [Neptuniibacter sp. QD37_11]|uniref:hypothetical protein n=1 Tax=Neptuniibacter sp. QD37_11 TaxID=3398209 RepID=UPI0039F623CE
MSIAYTCAILPLAVIQAFADAGFEEKQYPGHQGVYLAKQVQCGDLPYLEENNIIDMDYVRPEDDCLVELTPEGHLQFNVLNETSDYENYDPVVESQSWTELALSSGVSLSMDMASSS